MFGGGRLAAADWRRRTSLAEAERVEVEECAFKDV